MQPSQKMHNRAKGLSRLESRGSEKKRSCSVVAGVVEAEAESSSKAITSRLQYTRVTNGLFPTLANEEHKLHTW